jgi:GNAT superfamily N-acetyltransferase
MNNRFICAIVIIASCAYSNGHEASVVIEPYREERDWPAVEKIMEDYPSLKWCEHEGKPEGSTHKILTDPTCTTEVLRVDRRTIGFVNYIKIYDYKTFTFLLFRWSYVNSMGIDKEYRHQGYEAMLLNHVIDAAAQEHAQSLLISAAVHDSIGRDLYEKAGFTCFEVYDEEALYRLDFDVPPEKLPYNIIQRYSNSLLTIFGIPISYLYLKAIYGHWDLFYRQHDPAMSASPMH